MQDYASQIHDLFEDDSFPPIIAFSGKWGIGKTFYVKKHLTPELGQKSNKKVHYLSLMGITSIEDFKDLLVSKVYLEEKHDKTATTKLFDVFSAVEKHIGGNTTISSVIKGSTGAAKHYMLKSINDEIFVIDDIERLEDESLKKAILGECLNLSEKNEDKKNKFLFVTDFNILKIEPTYTEKIFSEVISFNPTPDDLYDIYDEKLKLLKSNKKEIIYQITSINLFNLRVLSRLLKRIETLLNELIDYKDIDLKIVKNKVIEGSFITAKLFYIDNKSRNEILKHSKIISSFIDNDKFVDYFTGATVDTKHIFDINNLPMEGKALDRLLYQQPHMLEEEDFQDGLKELKEYILSIENVHLRKFFECCYYHDYLVKSGFIEADVNIVYDKVEEIAKTKQFYSYRRSHSLKLSDNRYDSLMQTFIEDLDDSIHKSEIAELFNSMKQSFKYCSLNDDHSYKLRPVLHEFSNTDWENIFDIWQARDFGYFGSFLYERYRINNSRAIFDIEKTTISFLHNLTVKTELNEPISYKKGNLNYLLGALDYSKKELKI